MNPVGYAHILLKYSGIDKATKDNILLKVDGDLNRLQEIKDHLIKLAKSQLPSQIPNAYGYHSNVEADNGAWYTDGYEWWYEDWSDSPEGWYPESESAAWDWSWWQCYRLWDWLLQLISCWPDTDLNGQACLQQGGQV